MTDVRTDGHVRVSTPVKGFSGEVAGCHFANGAYEGPASTGALNYFHSAGYTVETLDNDPAEPDEAAPPAKTADKAEWLDFAVNHRGADRAEAEKLSRDKLAAAYGTTKEEL
ncbi:MAG: hypothetical protein ABIQ18_02320 [Umezawaea sp.]